MQYTVPFPFLLVCVKEIQLLIIFGWHIGWLICIYIYIYIYIYIFKYDCLYTLCNNLIIYKYWQISLNIFKLRYNIRHWYIVMIYLASFVKYKVMIYLTTLIATILILVGYLICISTL